METVALHQLSYGLLIGMATSFAVTFLSLRVLIPVAVTRGLVGRDRNKPGEPFVPEAGGFALLFGILAGLLIMLSLATFTILPLDVDLVLLLACVGVVSMAGFIGAVDDVLGLPQWLKAGPPALAALPLAAVKAGDSSMSLGGLFVVDLGLLYPLVVVPVGVTGASNDLISEVVEIE